MFINEFITNGLNDYFGENKPYSFEKHIIECICNIYGKENINRIYTSQNQNEFIKLIRMYGYSENSYLRFVGYTVEYENFKKSFAGNPNQKTDIYNKIESEVITMFGFKFLLGKTTKQEIDSFEYNLLNDFETTRLKLNTGLNPNFIQELWKKRRIEFKNSVDLYSVKTNYLDDETYKKFNIDLETVKQMDYRMVEKLNKSILERLKHPEEVIKEEVEKKSKFVLSSGNGFVDILIMVSIITTVISAGVIYIILR